MKLTTNYFGPKNKKKKIILCVHCIHQNVREISAYTCMPLSTCPRSERECIVFSQQSALILTSSVFTIDRRRKMPLMPPTNHNKSDQSIHIMRAYLHQSSITSVSHSHHFYGDASTSKKSRNNEKQLFIIENWIQCDAMRCNIIDKIWY